MPIDSAKREYNLENLMIKGKKAGMDDVIFYMVIIFVIAIVAVVGWMLMTTLNTSFQDSPNISTQGKSIFTSLKDRFIAIVDNSFLFIFIGVVLAVVIGAYMIPTHPVLFWLSIPIMAFIIFLGAIYANFFDAFISTPAFSSSAADFNILTFIMANYVYFITGIVLLVSVALFAKGIINQRTE